MMQSIRCAHCNEPFEFDEYKIEYRTRVIESQSSDAHRKDSSYASIMCPYCSKRTQVRRKMETEIARDEIEIEEEPKWKVVGKSNEIDDFYVRWGFETIRDSIKTANESLQRIGTFAVALTGGCIFLLGDKGRDFAEKGWVVAATFLFITTGAVALFGGLPELTPFRPLFPNDVESHKKRLISKRWWFLCASSALLFAGLFSALIGVIKK
jgi:hypothetical protein